MFSLCFRLIKEYRKEEEDNWSGIIWPGRSRVIPIDSPECGWQGELCIRSEINLLLTQGLPAMLSILLALTIITVVILKIRYGWDSIFNYILLSFMLLELTVITVIILRMRYEWNSILPYIVVVSFVVRVPVKV